MVRKVLIMSGHIPCVRGSLNLVSKRGLRGLHTDVFRVNDSVIKIKRWRKCTVQVAVTHHKYLRRIRTITKTTKAINKKEGKEKEVGDPLLIHPKFLG